MASILAPVVYLVVLVGSLLAFSRYYRKRVASRLADDPWFPSHPERNTYVTLLQQTDPPASEHLLKAALLRRAVADVRRIIRMREDKPALNSLVQKGSVGDDLWTRFLATEKELEAEILEVVLEANSYREGWGQIIFNTASEMVANERTREMYTQLNKAKNAVSSKNAKSPAPAALPAINGASTPVKTDSGSLVPPTPTDGTASPSTPGTPTGSISGKKGKKRK